MTNDDRPDDQESDTGPDEGVMLRPPAVVLDKKALIPERNLVRPAPNHFTHELVVDEPYHFDRPDQLDEPDGVLPARTQVALLVVGDERCRVVAGNGLYVEVRRASLRKLPDS
jgi:hypothetical protein